MTIEYEGSYQDVTFDVEVRGTISRTMTVTVRTPALGGYEYTEEDVRRIAENNFTELMNNIVSVNNAKAHLVRRLNKEEVLRL